MVFESNQPTQNPPNYYFHPSPLPAPLHGARETRFHAVGTVNTLSSSPRLTGNYKVLRRDSKLQAELHGWNNGYTRGLPRGLRVSPTAGALLRHVVPISSAELPREP